MNVTGTVAESPVLVVKLRLPVYTKPGVRFVMEAPTEKLATSPGASTLVEPSGTIERKPEPELAVAFRVIVVPV